MRIKQMVSSKFSQSSINVSFCGDHDNRVYSPHGVVAYQLSVEHGITAPFKLSNLFNPAED